MTRIESLVAAGFALVPIPRGKKRPTLRGWNLRENVITSPGEAHRLTGRNVGLAHAYCTPTPTCAIDIDNCKAANVWLAERGHDLKALLLADNAVVIWSGKRNSLKLLYRLPACMQPLPTKTVHGADNAMLLEFRCATRDGKTVQDVLPPSLHPAGHTYQWIGEGCPLALPEIPRTLLRLWRGLMDVRSAPAKPACAHAALPLEKTPRNMARVADLLSRISADCSYETYRAVIWALESLAWENIEDVQRQWSMTAPHRFDERTLHDLKRDYQRGDGRIGFGTLVHLSRSSSGVAVEHQR